MNPNVFVEQYSDTFQHLATDADEQVSQSPNPCWHKRSMT